MCKIKPSLNFSFRLHFTVAVKNSCCQVFVKDINQDKRSFLGFEIPLDTPPTYLDTLHDILVSKICQSLTLIFESAELSGNDTTTTPTDLSEGEMQVSKIIRFSFSSFHIFFVSKSGQGWWKEQRGRGQMPWRFRVQLHPQRLRWCQRGEPVYISKILTSIFQCLTEQHNCSDPAGCFNTIGGFECDEDLASGEGEECPEGFRW